MNDVKLTPEQIQSFQKKIFHWWKRNRRDLPWRHTHDPYKILISEVMLQQTQVPRVIAKYGEFIEQYPTIDDLSLSTPAEVLKIWKGMGYNRRALYLHKAAKSIVEAHKGKFPKKVKELAKLPGVGNYTARAILVFAYKQNIACVDTNIRRIITHSFFGGKPQKEAEIQVVADQLLPKGRSWQWHQALMDYGALEMQNGKLKMENGKRKSIPFRESSRFYRGRIIDRLREGNLHEDTIIREFQKKYGKSREFTWSILAGLARDGLILRAPTGRVSFPE